PGARCDPRPRGVHGGRTGGPARHSHRHPAGPGTHRGRNRTTPVYGPQQPLLHQRCPSAGVDPHRTGVHIRHSTLRRLAPTGVGRRPRPGLPVPHLLAARTRGHRPNGTNASRLIFSGTPFRTRFVRCSIPLAGYTLSEPNLPLRTARTLADRYIESTPRNT